MTMNLEKENNCRDEKKMTISGDTVGEVESFKYLGSFAQKKTMVLMRI